MWLAKPLWQLMGCISQDLLPSITQQEPKRPQSPAARLLEGVEVAHGPARMTMAVGAIHIPLPLTHGLCDWDHECGSCQCREERQKGVERDVHWQSGQLGTIVNPQDGDTDWIDHQPKASQQFSKRDTKPEKEAKLRKHMAISMRQTQIDGLLGTYSSWITTTGSLEGDVVGCGGVELALGAAEMSSEVSAEESTEVATVSAGLRAVKIVSDSLLVCGSFGPPS